MQKGLASSQHEQNIIWKIQHGETVPLLTQRLSPQLNVELTKFYTAQDTVYNSILLSLTAVVEKFFRDLFICISVLFILQFLMSGTLNPFDHFLVFESSNCTPPKEWF